METISASPKRGLLSAVWYDAGNKSVVTCFNKNNLKLYLLQFFDKNG